MGLRWGEGGMGWGWVGWDAARSSVYINLVTQTLNFIVTFSSDPNLTLTITVNWL